MQGVVDTFSDERPCEACSFVDSKRSTDNDSLTAFHNGPEPGPRMLPRARELSVPTFLVSFQRVVEQLTTGRELGPPDSPPPITFS